VPWGQVSPLPGDDNSLAFTKNIMRHEKVRKTQQDEENKQSIEEV
jgi:hypothetical protein